MTNKYQRYMEKIHVTDDMKNRIINNVVNVQFKKDEPLLKDNKRTFSIKRSLKYAVIVSILLIGLSRINYDPDMLKGLQGNEEHTEYSTLYELEDAIGYNVPLLTVVPFDVDEINYYSQNNSLVSVRYVGNGDSIIFSMGMTDNYTSDNFEVFNKSTITYNDLLISVGIDGFNNQIVAWKDGKYIYFLESTNILTDSQIIEIVSASKTD